MPPREGVLERDRTCWGFPCKAGTTIDPVWRSGTLARDFAYRGVVLPEGSTFFLDEPLDVAHVTISRATSVHGHRVAGGSTLELAPFPPPLTVVYTLLLLPLYPLFAWRAYRQSVVGQALVVEPTEPMRFGDIDAVPGDRVYLARNGLLGLMLGSPRALRGHALETGFVTFATSGAIQAILLYRSQWLAGFPCFGSGLVGTDVVFDAEARARRFVLAEEWTIGGVSYSRGTRIDRDARGKVTKAKIIDVDVALYTHRPDIARRAACL